MYDFDALLSSFEEPDSSSREDLCDVFLDLCQQNARVNVTEREEPPLSVELRRRLIQDIVKLLETNQVTTNQSLQLLDEVRTVIQPKTAQAARELGQLMRAALDLRTSESAPSPPYGTHRSRFDGTDQGELRPSSS
ncbi:hypothetical protein W02_27340 [Nitrospira sp. KM1]|uniref:hypothetical protein n=1 Tax=Nitrospira sp. KM1 TaxID=1936990 RepID=UPI0013A7417F|nr:hypothetical protein [Nitrospira sp. KM1]BCA55594.1 hypothetical protein W02_27340 [Nitrospira sp. KM1]